MSTKTKESLKIVSQEEIGTGIFSMWLQADRMAETARRDSFYLCIQGTEANCFRVRSVSARSTERTEGSVLYTV